MTDDTLCNQLNTELCDPLLEENHMPTHVIQLLHLA